VLAGELLAAGSPGDDIGGANAGSVTVYRIGTDFVNYCLATMNSTGFAGIFYYGASTTQVASGHGQRLAVALRPEREHIRRRTACPDFGSIGERSVVAHAAHEHLRVDDTRTERDGGESRR
jgi:hypothetical protein